MSSDIPEFGFEGFDDYEEGVFSDNSNHELEENPIASTKHDPHPHGVKRQRTVTPHGRILKSKKSRYRSDWENEERENYSLYDDNLEDEYNFFDDETEDDEYEGLLEYDSESQFNPSSPVVFPTILTDEEVLKYLPHLERREGEQPVSLHPRITHVKADAVITYRGRFPALPLRELSYVIRTSEYTSPFRSSCLGSSSVGSYLTIFLHPGLFDRKPVIRLWTSGALSISGVRTEEDAQNVAQTVVRLLQMAIDKLCNALPSRSPYDENANPVSLKEELSLSKFRIGTTFAVFQSNRKVRLDCLANSKVSLEELKGVGCFFLQHSPGSQCCVAWLEGMGRNTHENFWRVRCRVHVSGRIQFFGARSMQEVLYAFHTLLPLLFNHMHCD